MTAVRLALVALGAYNLGAHDPYGLLGAAVVLAAIEAGRWTLQARRRRERRSWDERRLTGGCVSGAGAEGTAGAGSSRAAPLTHHPNGPRRNP